MSASTWGWLVLALPLAGSVAIALGYRALPGRAAGWLGTGAVLGSFACSVGALLALLDLPAEERSVTSGAFDYLRTTGVDVDLGILVDPLSVFMILVVSGVSFLIHVYSVGYMESDRGYARFFAYLNFFVFSMLLLVLAGNLVLLIVGWAFVAVASTLLISFWYRRSTATAAGYKAFIIQVIGDIGLVLAAFLLFAETGQLEYGAVFEGAQNAFLEDDGTLVAICLLLLVGAFAKSAQLPLHTWLPDAMEGPTPVSALIHAATMVTAGVYLIARMHPLFEMAPTAAAVGAIVGTLTLFFAATVALVVTDLKRIIAYSTMSQIGYMILGVCTFAYGAGLFHLMTHAFFKALLFMGAGSVISAMGGIQSIDRMGGFRRVMPFTFATFSVGALALAGFPFFSGWFSKDEILSFALHRGGLYAVLAGVGLVAAVLTAFYSFRMVFRVFYGEPSVEVQLMERGLHAPAPHQNPATGEHEDTDVGFPGPEHHTAEHSAPMRAAMTPLAVLALVGGLVAVPGVTETLTQFLEPTFEGSDHVETHPSTTAAWLGLVAGGAIAIGGILVAHLLYIRRPGETLGLRDRYRSVHDFLAAKWYFDELFDRLLVRPVTAFATFGRRHFEGAVIQGVMVGGSSGVVRAGSALVRTVQSGYLRAYALALVVGVAGLGLYFLLVSG